MITFLDCTLRDGGYYNDWDFDPEKARQLILALNEAGVQIIEIGYKSPVNTEKFYGLFKNCNESYLQFLSKSDSADYAFMIDVKEFITNGSVDTKALDEHIFPADESVFTWVRLASHYATVNHIPALTNYFKQKGYRVGFNLMGGSLLSDNQIKTGLKYASESGVEVFYIADSFGSFYPDDIRRIVRMIRANYTGEIGIHTHDNQGMAYANTLVAIEEGVSFVDGTVTGMGRGAGNLLTEQFLLGYALKNNTDQYDASALLNMIESYIQPMKEKHKWGYNNSYMYSGLRNIHPTYGQALASADRYTSSEIGKILARIPEENRTKYEASVLKDAIKHEINQDQAEAGSSTVTKIKDLEDGIAIILAKGSEARTHIPAILQLKNKHNATLIECNHTGSLFGQDQGVKVILNQPKLQEWLDDEADTDSANLFTGRPRPQDCPIASWNYLPFSIAPFSIDGVGISIPDYDAGLYALGLALKSGAKVIYLAGFDGFENSEVNETKEFFLKQVLDVAKANQVEIKHITRTSYNVFPKQSLYTL